MVRLKVRALPLGHPAGKNPVMGAAFAPGSHSRPSPSSSCIIKRGSSLSRLGCHLKTTVISVSCEPWSMQRAYCGGPHGQHAGRCKPARTKELLVRMGHSSSQAALIYQYASEERDAAIAIPLETPK